MLLEQLNAVFNAIVDFLKKVRDKLMKAWNVVVDVVSAGIDVIKLYLVFPSEPVASTTETVPTETERKLGALHRKSHLEGIYRLSDNLCSLHKDLWLPRERPYHNAAPPRD